jgi:hypothetical protein
MELVPVSGLAANFSPIPRIDPPPLGKEMLGTGAGDPAVVLSASVLGVRDCGIETSYKKAPVATFLTGKLIKIGAFTKKT